MARPAGRSETDAHAAEPDQRSNSIKAFNDLFGTISRTDSDRLGQLVTAKIPARLAADPADQNPLNNSGKQNARIKQFMDNESFRRWITDTVFGLTYGNH